MSRLILASTSPIRIQILSRAGVPFKVEPPNLDEEEFKRSLSCVTEQVPVELARAKALSVSRGGKNKGRSADVVLSCDQILVCDGVIEHKSPSREAARSKLALLRGRRHDLIGHAVLARCGQILWEHTSISRLKMRNFSDQFLDLYMSTAPDDILRSVGCYQLEGLGAQLFDSVEGDYFSILGLPLLPLLRALRKWSLLVS